MTHELHPLCTLFPRMGGAEFDALCADIKANGLREAITLHNGMILDGGNRYRACVAAGVEPVFCEFGGGNLVSFVLSANLHRRHMTQGQQAAIVSSAQDWAKAQTVGNPAFKAQRCNVAPLDTAAGRAAESGASLRTQKMADKVAKADPVLAKRVAHGEVSLPKALRQVEDKPEPAPKPAKPRRELPAAPAAEYEVDNLRATMHALAEQNEHLEARLAVEAMDASEDEKTAAAALIRELQSQVKTLEAEADALRSMRDSLLTENGALKRQCESLVRRLKKLEQPA